MFAQLERWLEKPDDAKVIEAHLDLPGMGWVEVIELDRDEETATFTYQGLGLLDQLSGSGELQCKVEALTAVRRRERFSADWD